MTTQPNPTNSATFHRNSAVSEQAADHHERKKKMNNLAESQSDVPSLDMVRSSVSSGITQIVEYYLNGCHRCAHVDEIVDGIQIANGAERESIYSTIDPYTDGAVKRDDNRPLIFRRVSPGQYEFLGFDGDPLDLTKKLTFRNELIREAYSVFLGFIRKKGKEAEFKSKSTSERIQVFHASLTKAPALIEIASANLSFRQSITQLKL